MSALPIPAAVAAAQRLLRLACNHPPHAMYPPAAQPLWRRHSSSPVGAPAEVASCSRTPLVPCRAAMPMEPLAYMVPCAGRACPPAAGHAETGVPVGKLRALLCASWTRYASSPSTLCTPPLPFSSCALSRRPTTLSPPPSFATSTAMYLRTAPPAAQSSCSSRPSSRSPPPLPGSPPVASPPASECGSDHLTPPPTSQRPGC